MTLIKPSLFLKRIALFHAGKPVYDEIFQKGVNIICGENSSGKSTITELIHYALGGEILRWKTEASQCDIIYAEIEINNSTITLRREISKKNRRPIEICWGDYNKAIQHSTDLWQKYPFQRSQSKESFSQCLFRAMEMPEVRGEKSSNITMHQILRLIYCDQMTPADRLFRFEQFDTQLHRQTIGDLLCGIYSNDLYEKQLLLDKYNKNFEVLTQRLKAIQEILHDADQSINLEKIEKKIEELENTKKSLYDSLIELKQSIDLDDEKQEKSNLSIELVQNLISIRSEVSNLRTKKDQLEFEILDSQEFIKTINDRISALIESQTIRFSFKEMNFIFCPACLAPIEKNDDTDTNCGLCKTKKDSERDDTYYLMMRQELEQQIKESESLLEIRKSDLKSINKILPEKISREQDCLLKLESYSHTPSTDRDDKIEKLNRKIGYIERSIENTHEQARLLSLIEDIMQRKAEISKSISLLNDQIKSIKLDLKEKKETAYEEIAILTKSLLKKDLDREDEFKYADIIDFDFSGDSISVDGKRQFSASSMVYLKNSFHLALVWASARKDFFNYPRLAIFDNIEDKGMEQERSHNFQRKIIEISSQLKAEHQIIFATSMIAPELKESTFQIGRYYTHDYKSLEFK